MTAASRFERAARVAEMRARALRYVPRPLSFAERVHRDFSVERARSLYIGIGKLSDLYGWQRFAAVLRARAALEIRRENDHPRHRAVWGRHVREALEQARHFRRAARAEKRRRA